MEINRSNIMEITRNANARPDKDYGQNFLVEPDVCEKIVSSLDLSKDEKVLEIGPGLGSLTHFIDLLNKNLTVVDIDERMIAFLSIVYKNVNIINSDIRKFDVSGYEKIVANLPYNITTETIAYLLMNARNVKKMVLMVQSDAFPHFYDVKGKEYGPVSILLHLLGESKKLFQVKAGCFYPVPKCGSTVFEINISQQWEIDLAKEVYLFSKNLFLNRRKTILNNLQNLLKNRLFAENLLQKCHIFPNLRPEDISPLGYLNLYKEYKRTIKNKDGEL